jgi:lambda family phage portal protein
VTKRLPVVPPSRFERALAYVAPGYATAINKTRTNFAYRVAMAGQYNGARSLRAALKSWLPWIGSADGDTLGDLPALRGRARDLTRNNPIAVGARSTSRINVVGSGLRVRSKINAALLGLSEEAANAWERKAETIFHMWASSKLCDVSLTQNFYEQQGLVFNTKFDSGDAFVLRRMPTRPGAVLPLALDVVEADRVGTPYDHIGNYYIRDGVRIDENGAPVSYFVFDYHPGDVTAFGLYAYQEIPAYGEKTGEKLVLHLYDKDRPGQSRGIPALAPVIELLKQLDRYSEAELMKAVVSSFFTVFLKTETDDTGIPNAMPGHMSYQGPNDVAMGPGTIVDIGTNEDIQTAQPANTSNFDPFFQSVVRQIGVALSIPFELLMQHFQSSYSASRAALEIAAQFFRDRRVWLVRNFCDPVYDWVIYSAIVSGRLEAPGFFDDPILRAAWLGTEWIGPGRMTLDPLKEWKAETEAVNLGARTIEQVIIERGGGDFEQVNAQRVKEHAARAAGNLEPQVLAPAGMGSKLEEDMDEEIGPGGKQESKKDAPAK